MPTNEYWARRAEALAARGHAKAESTTATMTRDYERAAASIRRDIEAFYGRYATNNGVSLADARKQLDARELADFKMTLDEFRGRHLSGEFAREVDNASIRVRLSRLEALEMQMRGRVEELKAKQAEGIETLLGDAYEDRYHRGIYEAQKAMGFGHTFAQLDEAKIRRAIAEPWLGDNFSGRIWADRDKLVREIHTSLLHGLIRGDGIEQMTKELSERMGASRSRCKTIVRTETAHIIEDAAIAGYKEMGFEEYIFIAALDEKTCPVCGALDNQVFKVSEAEEGVNRAPIHPNCGCTEGPYFGELEGTRTARGPDGESYEVPAGMSYAQWREEHAQKSEPAPTTPERPAPEPSVPKIEFSDAESLSDARKYAHDVLGIEKPSYAGLSLESANTINQQIAGAYNDYPELRGFVGEIKTNSRGTSYAAASLRADRTASGDYQISRILEISKSTMGDMAKTEVYYARDVGSGFHPLGTTAKSIIDHELGHMIEYARTANKYGLDLNGPISADKKSMLFAAARDHDYASAVAQRAADALGVSVDDLAVQVSRYAKTNASELLAEAVAEYRTSQSPRDACKAVIKALK